MTDLSAVVVVPAYGLHFSRHVLSVFMGISGPSYPHFLEKSVGFSSETDQFIYDHPF